MFNAGRDKNHHSGAHQMSLAIQFHYTFALENFAFIAALLCYEIQIAKVPRMSLNSARHKRVPDGETVEAPTFRPKGPWHRVLQ